jgi:hypothetical protein
MSAVTKPSPAMAAKLAAEVKASLSTANLVDLTPRKVVEVQLTTEQLIEKISDYALVHLEGRTLSWSGERWGLACQYLEVLTYGNAEPDFRVKIDEDDLIEVRKSFVYAMYMFRNFVSPQMRQQIPGTKPRKNDWYKDLYELIELDNRKKQPAITAKELADLI